MEDSFLAFIRFHTVIGCDVNPGMKLLSILQTLDKLMLMFIIVLQKDDNLICILLLVAVC